MVQRCAKCRRLGIGPNAIKLWQFEGLMYCKEHYHDKLTWDESRSSVIMGLMFENAKPAPPPKKYKPLNWRGYIEEHSGMAAWALTVGDRKTFVYHFTRAMYAWTLKEQDGLSRQDP